MKKWRRLAHRILGVAICVTVVPVIASTQLIEPTRSLGAAEKDSGMIAVYSEPPELAVSLNGAVVGKTPFVKPGAEPGLYVVAVNEKEKQINVAPGKTVRVSYYKGDIFILPEKRPEPQKKPQAVEEKLESKTPRERPSSRDLGYVPLYWPLDPRGPIY